MTLITALALAIGALFLVGTQAAGAASEPRMQFDKRMKVETVCFAVTNPSGGQTTLFAMRCTSTIAGVSELTGPSV